ncbi:MAG: ABC transporter substrate-binding protein [Burkholderiaceae bacterium]|nr:ABC transporter substrate-binding protein [Burkholderiaceae bacterium]
MKASRFLALAVTVAALIAPSAPLQAQPPTTIRIGHASAGSMSLAAGLLLQARPDIMKKHGLVGEWSDFSATPNNCISSIVAERIDACSHGFANMLSAAAQGAKLRAVAAYSRPQMTLVLAKTTAAAKGVAPDAPLAQRIGALKGVSVARPPKGTTGYATLTLVLNAAGLKVEDFGATYEMFDPAAMAAGVRNKKWEAASWSSGPLEQAIVDGSAYRWISVPRDAGAGAEFASHGMLISSGFADRNEDAVRRLYAAVKEATDLLRNRDPNALEDLRQAFFSKMSPELYQVAMTEAASALLESPSISPEAFEKLVAFARASTTKGNLDALTYEGSVDRVARAAK